MSTIEADLRERWLPSADQMALADALLAAGYDQDRDVPWSYLDKSGTSVESGVYTVHLLINKEYGWWDEGVEIVHLDGVFLSRQAACDFVEAAARKRHAGSGEKIVGGYAWHSRVGHAAVWEDIGSLFPIPEWSARANKEA